MPLRSARCAGYRRFGCANGTIMNGSVVVLLSGSFPDALNSNLVLRSYLAAGFADCVGEGAVRNVPLEVLPAGIDYYRPQLVVCLGSCPPEVVNYSGARAACDRVGSHLAFWLHDDPYEIDLAYSATEVADTIFTNDSWSALHYRHPRTFHLPLAACPRAHFRPWTEHKRTDVFFCGVGYDNRISILRDSQQTLVRLRTQVLGDQWPADLPFCENRRIGNDALADGCAQSWITLSLGRSFDLANRRYQLNSVTPGPRIFEAAMSGTVQLVFADSLEILDYFPSGEGILLFDGPEDFAKQARAVLGDSQRGARHRPYRTENRDGLPHLCAPRRGHPGAVWTLRGQSA